MQIDINYKIYDSVLKRYPGHDPGAVIEVIVQSFLESKRDVIFEQKKSNHLLPNCSENSGDSIVKLFRSRHKS